VSAFYQQLEPVSRQLTIVVGLTVVGFMAFGLALSFYRNVLFQEQLYKMEAENKALEDRIQLSREDLDYYRSSSYKDKYAKENLNRLQPGEKLLIITDEQDASAALDAERQSSEQVEALYEELLRNMPVIEHWKLFLFYKEKIQRLKAGL
jgi:cell division protein FtsB